MFYQFDRDFSQLWLYAFVQKGDSMHIIRIYYLGRLYSKFFIINTMRVYVLINSGCLRVGK